MTTRGRILLGFDSIHDVLRAEKLIRGAGLWCDLVPTPRELSSDCGMSIEVREEDWPGIEALRESIGWRWP